MIRLPKTPSLRTSRVTALASPVSNNALARKILQHIGSKINLGYPVQAKEDKVLFSKSFEGITFKVIAIGWQDDLCEDVTPLEIKITLPKDLSSNDISNCLEFQIILENSDLLQDDAQPRDLFTQAHFQSKHKLLRLNEDDRPRKSVYFKTLYLPNGNRYSLKILKVNENR